MDGFALVSPGDTALNMGNVLQRIEQIQNFIPLIPLWARSVFKPKNKLTASRTKKKCFIIFSKVILKVEFFEKYLECMLFF